MLASGLFLWCEKFWTDKARPPEAAPNRTTNGQGRIAISFMKHGDFQVHRQESVQEALARIAGGLINKALTAIQRRARRRPEDVHQVRLLIKRLRALLRLVRPVASERFFRRENTRLRIAADDLALVRDVAVARQTLQGLLHTVSKGRGAIKRVLNSLAEQRMGEAELPERREQAMQQAARALEETRKRFQHLRLATDEWLAIGPGVEEVYRQARKFMSRAFSKGHDADYHEWRKRVKYLYFQLLTLERAWPMRLSKISNKLKTLGSKLGHEHDVIVLKGFLLRASERSGGEQAVREVISCLDKRNAELRRQCKKLGKALFQQGPRKFAKKLGRHWAVWRASEKR